MSEDKEELETPLSRESHEEQESDSSPRVYTEEEEAA